jgi:phospholipid/cholesterol/gamma-HCH transport system substrate-binding protein
MQALRDIRNRLGVYFYVLLGLVALVVTAVILITDYTGGLQSLFGPDQHTVTAVVKDSKSLRRSDQVRIHGVKVGEVTSISPGPNARTSVVKMSVDNSAGTIYRDAWAHVRWRTLLGGNFALVIDPGHSSSGDLGSSPIPARHSTSQVELDDVISTISGSARRGLKTLMPETAKALSDPHTLAEVTSALARVAPDVAHGVGALRGEDQDRDLVRLVSQTARTVQALRTPDHQLRSLVEGGAATLQTTAARQGDLRSTLASAPGVMRRADRTLTDLDTTLHVADPLVAKLQAPATQVAPTLHRLHPVVGGADRLLTRATPLLHDLRPAVTHLAHTSRDAIPLLDDLQPSLDRLDHTILPYINQVDPETKHTTAEMVGPGAGGLALVATQMDANGHFLRFEATTGSSFLYLPCQTYIANPDKKQLLECKSLQTELNQILTTNPEGPVKGTVPAGSTEPRP